jgi:DNA polymerase-3 subunit alpha
VAQFDKSDVEKVGLVKFDFLGLRTLTIIDWALAMINAQRTPSGTGGARHQRLPLDDPGSTHCWHAPRPPPFSSSNRAA